MQPELNCSSHCDSPFCSIPLGVNRQEGLDALQRLCSVSTVSAELPRRALSPVLSAVVWTLLSGGILLVCCFLLFTLRFKNNRIVKMSSPNLNVLTLIGSLLTYISGFLFAVDERTLSHVGPSTPLIHARVWTLCIGSTLVFGPILGKTWRLYRVFTQRLPDKRVIIRDIQLMGMVALLILVDLLILTIWNLSDPVRCSRSVGAVVKVVEKGIFYSLSQMDSCSSEYPDLWAIIIAVQKGCLLFYGTYLAGLTSNVSHPPVNQSPTIITAVTLVTLSMAVVVPVSIFLQTWPNLVYSAVAGAIFICTSATNCMLFVPQMMQWRQFEEDQNNPGQMAKYFSSPSKSQPSVYSEDEIYYLLGENNSMKKLLNEKNAVIDSLQEQVKNAKDKLLRLMSASQQCEDQDMDSSATNLNSSSTQTTEIQSDGPSSSSLPHEESKSPPSPTHHTAADVSSPVVALSHRHLTPPNNSSPVAVSSPHSGDLPQGCKSFNSVSIPETTVLDTSEAKRSEDVQQSVQSSGSLRTPDETVRFVNSLQNRRGLNPFRLETVGTHGGFTSHMRPTGFVSSEQLQEILQELSLDAVMGSSLRSPDQRTRLSSQRMFPEASTLSPLSLRTPRSPRSPTIFNYPTISPYAMRKRRPPFGSSRRGLDPSCFYTECRHTKQTCEKPRPVKNNDEVTASGAVQFNEEDENQETAKQLQTEIVSQSHRCVEHDHRAPPVAGAAADSGRQPRHCRDSCGYWDSDSSSSTDYCYYHRPYCDACIQRGELITSDSSSDSSDSEYEGYAGTYGSSHPVVFKEDLKPTFV